MIHSTFKQLRLGLGAVCVAAFLSPGAVRAAEPSIEEMKARLDRLEKQNEHLQRVLESGGLQATGGGAGQSKADVEKIIADYMKAQAASAKAAEEKKKKEADEKGYEVGKDLTFKASWKDAPAFESGDKAFKVQLRGRWHNHWGWISGDDATLNSIFNNRGAPEESDFGDDGTIFRRGRLGVQGTIWETADFVAEFEFASGSVVWREVWMGMHDLPLVGRAQIGHFKEYFSIEQLTSSRFLTFVERSIIDGPVDDNLAYNTGFGFTKNCCEERINLSAGMFRHTQDQGQDVGDGDYNYTARAWIVPVWEHNGRCAVHLGAAASMRQPPGVPGFPQDGGIRFRTRPYRIEPDEFLDVSGSGSTAPASNLVITDYTVFGVEAAAVFGPFSIQAEYHNWSLNNARTATQDIALEQDIKYSGYYVFASYFITGENRAYTRNTGAFGRIKPYENFWIVDAGEEGCGGSCCGKGAWEIAARYAHLNLNDGGLGGRRGELDQYTFGVNWYWNPNMKIQTNYEWFELSNTGSSIVPGNTRQILMAACWDF